MSKARLYSLFIKVNGKRYRISEEEYTKSTAVSFFQSRLIGFMHFSAELRPVGKQPVYYLVFPAYGREYNTPEEALTDWNGGKDFSLRPGTGPYLSKRDNLKVIICYKHGTKVVVP